MKLPDVNVLVSAFRADLDLHEVAHRWLESAVASREQLGLTPAVATGFVRVVTNHRIFARPTSTAEALGVIDALHAGAAAIDVAPGPRHWEIFAELCREAGASGNVIADAGHAATAIEHDATWVTFDRDFARFPRLRWEVPGAVA